MTTTKETLSNGLIIGIAGVFGLGYDYIFGLDYSFSGGMIWAGWLLILMYVVFNTVETKAGVP